MWRELIASWEPNPVFFPPASTTAIEDAEQKLNLVFPDELKSLLLESNGISRRLFFETKEGSLVYDEPLVWPVEDIMNLNIEQRHGRYPAYTSSETLLFFADAGTGDQYAYSIAEGRPVGTSIWAWDHEDDGRQEFATSLRDFLEGWLRGMMEG